MSCSTPPSRSWIALYALGLACASTPPPSPEAPPANAPSEAGAAAAPEAAGAPPEAAEPTPAPAAASASAPAEPGAQPPQDSRTRNEIQAVMAENRNKVRACYDAALAQNPGIHGSLVIKFVIDPRGEVKQAEVSWPDSDIHVPELDTCAVDAVKTIKFPPSSRGLESSVNYPFNFNPPRTPPPQR